MSSGITFYTNPMSRGQIIRWLLEETGLEYNTEIVEWGGSYQWGDYKSINPMSKVPAIVHNKQVVTECAAICCYIADAFPETQLKAQGHHLADYYRWLFFAAGPIEAAITDRTLGVEIPKEKEGMVGYGNFERMLSTLKLALKNKKYIAGQSFTAADVYVGSMVGWGLEFSSLPQEPELVDYWNGLKDRPAYIRGKKKDEALIQAQ